MAEYSPDDAKYAANIVARLTNREAEGLDLEQDVVVSDVESDANAFSDDLSLLQEFDARAPAVRIAGEMVPVSLGFAIGRSERSSQFPPFGYMGRRPWRGHPFFHEFMYEFLRPILRNERGIDGFTSMDREEARVTFVARATDFVATRIAAVRRFRNQDRDQTWQRSSPLNLRQLLRGRQVTTPGCHFTVSANSDGLRVFWSGAYYVTPNNFNHPTSPTSSVLQSGTYIFGVDGGAYGNNIEWDLNCVVSLPGQPYAHLNF
jgi:hypothetical protein